MKRVLFGERFTVFGVVVFALSGCASPSITRSSTAVSRSPASVAAKFGLECVAEASLFEASTGDDSSQSKDDAISNSLGRLSGEDRSIATARALAEAFAYGQNLVAEYDRLLGLGYSLERIRQTTSVYAELHALYFLKGELESFATKQLAESVLSRLESEPAGGGPARGLALLSEAAGSSLARWKSYIMAATGDPAYGILALDEIEHKVLETNDLARECVSVGALFEAQTKLALANHTAQVMLTARGLVRNISAYLAFQPRTGADGFAVAELVRERAKAIRREWKSMAARTPQSAPSDLVVYPSSGKAGNMFGNNFPKGVWALTFDDGPHGGISAEASYTKRVLENLRRHDLKATFFILSQNVSKRDCEGVGPRTVFVRDQKGNVTNERRVNIRGDRPRVIHPELAIAARELGHAIASHSYYHSQVPKGNAAEQNCEIGQAVGELEEALGSRPEYYRLPYGAGVGVPIVRSKMADAKLVHVHWSVDTLDWQDRDPESIYRRTVQAMALSGQGIVLFHDVHPQSVIASEKVMAYLKDPNNALEAVTIPEVVNRLNGGQPTRQSADAPFGAK